MTGNTDIHEKMVSNDATNGAISALAIVSAELMETIHGAHLALEDCVDGRGGTAALRRTGELLHQACGALRMTETYGAALLVEEMEFACDYLAKLQPGKGREDGLDALTRSMVQLPIYVERLLAGGRDIALVLLPMLNDLRAARGQPLLSEGTLLLLNLSPTQSRRSGDERIGNNEDPVLVTKRLRPKFQLALLGWIKGNDGGRHIAALSQVSQALENSATRDDMYQLWWIVGGVLEALQNGGLDTSVALKRLLGQADRQLKHTIDEGLLAYEKFPVNDLLNNLLYYVARSAVSGTKINEIRTEFNLAELLPGDKQVENAREALSAPSAKLMSTVASAIRDDLSRVKDVLDIFVRTGMNKSSELVPQLELLKKISDTLGVLGLGELRGDVEGEIERLKAVVERGGIANDKIILDIAATLLRVEDRLDQQLLRLTAPSDGPANDAPPDDEDFKRVAKSVMRECIINLARIKETITQSIADESVSQGLDNIPSLISGIKAGLLLLDKTRAMEVVDRVGELVVAILNTGGANSLNQKETDRLADAIVSIEYYMETVKAGRSEPWYMLDNAEACLTVLRDVELRIVAVQQEDPAAAAFEATQKLDTAAMQAAAEAALVTPDAAKLQATDVIPLPVVAQEAEHIDPELLEIFIEEAKEEVASIKKHLPNWCAAPDNMETLITVRRSFHTLKGSGRMVGAERIGEYCWSVENLLNRLINHTLLRTPPMVTFIQEAAAAVPELVEQLEVGEKPQANINLLIARANAFADGDPNAAVLIIESQHDEPAAPEPALEMDPVLYDIFSKETAGHLQVIMDYLDACDGHQPPFAVTDKLHRACHTLHGSANMANVERGVAVAAILNRYVRRIYDHNLGFEQAGLGALRAAGSAIASIVSDINNPNKDRADYSTLIDHITRLADQVLPTDTEVIDPVETPNVMTPAVPSDANDSSDATADNVEYDAEIAAIFTEESAELLESADQALIDWSANRSAQPMEELKRHLHTLKGGARMAGIAAMGDLSHELETLLISVDDGRVEPTMKIDELLQRSVDELHRMRDSVIAGKPVRASNDLLQRIQNANTGIDESETGEWAVVDATNDNSSATEFTIEPDETVSMVIVDSPFADQLDALVREQAEHDDIDVDAERVLGDEDDQTKSLRSLVLDTKTDIEGLSEAVEVADPATVAEPPSTEAEQPDLVIESAPDDVAGDIKAPVSTEFDEVDVVDGKATREPEPVETMPTPPSAPEVIPIPKPAADVRALRSPETRQEFARIDAELLEDLLNAAGEISIYHSRLSQQVNSFEFHVEELEQTIARLREQLRKLEIETEAQIMHGHQDTLVARDFDPLELDRYSNIQQLSRALAESASDLGSLKDLLQSVTAEADGLLVQQSRVTAELQDGLMRTRMVPFERHVGRLTRLVRQAATESKKRAELAVEGASGELDRQVLEKMLPPFEHMLRNAVIHGIETAESRQAAGKPAVGRITIRLHREGAEMVIDVADDGAGLDVSAIRRKAYELDLLQPDSKATDEEIMQLILTPGFSTASAVTQSAGRGVGMDVVANEVKKLGGSLRISSVTGQGTNFTVRLPFTLAITQALIVRTGEEIYALPLPTVEGVARIPRAELQNLLNQSEPSYQYGEQSYKFRHLGMYLGGQAAQLPEDDPFISVILVQAGNYSAALLVDEMLASREIVVKAVGPQLASIRGISGATILGDGSIILILDIHALVRTGAPVVEIKKAAPTPADDRPLALVVDDSITVRRVTERFLHRNGMRCVTAKDGLDAISAMQDARPDVILLDIEMPRMDGYEFASHVRNDSRVADVPIIMITSRVGDKHRARAIELGVNDYLGKPYQDTQLLEAIRRQLEERGIELA